MGHVLDHAVYVGTYGDPPYTADCGACNWYHQSDTVAEADEAGAAHVSSAHRPPRPEFTDEQITWLRDVLGARCCHVTGEHDPLHYREQRYICDMQQGAAWTRAILALGFDDLADPTAAEPYDNCWWCKRHAEQSEKQSA